MTKWASDFVKGYRCDGVTKVENRTEDAVIDRSSCCKRAKRQHQIKRTLEFGVVSNVVEWGDCAAVCYLIGAIREYYLCCRKIVINI